MKSVIVAVAAIVAGAALAGQSSAPPQASPQSANDDTVHRIRASIAGREQEPAGQVFKNVQFLRNTRAGTFLTIMNAGYSKALGVACSYCHDESDFASDAKRPKRAAREMQTLHRAFNDGLREMKDADSPSDDRAISCITCHRGAVKPLRG
jgi:Photosynthetic reaction centre cytochrome C subunit